MPNYPDHLTPTSTPSKLKQRSRARREPSGVFALFQTPQIQQFKEAFSLIDQDGDGIVSEQDLKGIFASLGSFVYEPCYKLRIIPHWDFRPAAIQKVI